MDTSTVSDSDDFSEKEWTSRKKEQRRDNAKKIKCCSHSLQDKESPEHYHKISQRSQDLSQLPSLPKLPVISLVSQSSEATTSKVVDEVQSNMKISFYYC